jgi:hypothetical protein
LVPIWTFDIGLASPFVSDFDIRISDFPGGLPPLWAEILVIRGIYSGTSDQYHWFVLSVMDAVRGNRDCGGLAWTVAVRPDGT